MPTMMLKIESISDMKPMSSAVASAVSVTSDVAGGFGVRRVDQPLTNEG